MSTVDCIFVGQSNTFYTDTRTAPAAVLQQPDVPAFDVNQYSVADLRVKARPWRPLDSRYVSYPQSASRQWCGAPEAAVRRLIDVHGHSPRMIRYGIGSSNIYADWPTTYRLNAIFTSYVGAALASRRYPGTPNRRVIITIQGESDTLIQLAVDNYLASYTAWVTALRAAVGDPACHVICVQLNTAQSIGVLNGIADIRADQAAWVAGDANATLLDPSPLGGISGDSIHYSQAGAAALGGAIADAVDALL